MAEYQTTTSAKFQVPFTHRRRGVTVRAKSCSVNVDLPVLNAPKVRGTSAYLVPDRICWTVHAWRTHGADRSNIYISATADGTKPDSRERARGSYIVDLNETLPEWVERPEAWLARAEDLVRDAMGDVR